MLDADKNNLVRALRAQLSDEKVIIRQIRFAHEEWYQAYFYLRQGDALIPCYRYKVWVVLAPRKESKS